MSDPLPWERRVALVTGKGGVGRTTLAAALARTAHAKGYRTLILELIDETSLKRSSLAELFGLQSFGPVPRMLQPGLWAAHLWPAKGHEEFLARFSPSRTLVSAALQLKPLRAFLEAAPSLKEMGWYHHLLMLLEEKRGPKEWQFERVILDMPATGHTVALAHLPDVLEEMIPTGPVRDLLARGRAILNDPKQALSWAVSLPERLPLTETRELIAGLEPAFVYHGGIIINQSFPEHFSEADHAMLEGLVGMYRHEGLRERGLLSAGGFLQSEIAWAEVRGWGRPLLSVPRFPGESGASLVEKMRASLEEGFV